MEMMGALKHPDLCPQRSEHDCETILKPSAVLREAYDAAEYSARLTARGGRVIGTPKELFLSLMRTGSAHLRGPSNDTRALHCAISRTSSSPTGRSFGFQVGTVDHSWRRSDILHTHTPGSYHYPLAIFAFCLSVRTTERAPMASSLEKPLSRSASCGGSKPVKSTSILDDGKPPPPSLLPPDVIPCTFAPGEALNPVNWPSRKKFRCVVLALVYAALTGLNIGLYSESIPDLRQGMRGDPSDTAMTLGISVWVWAVALAPLVLAPFSERVLYF